MALKVSVTLPNGTIIVLECDEPQTYASLASLALRELPHDLGVTPGERAPTRAPEPTARPPTAVSEGAEEFRNFCREANPLGDMRRVVVAAEGARRFLAMGAVSPQELSSLFEAAGWPRPANFVQTLRNAARSSFRWLERVHGRRGYYTVTDKGRAEVLRSRAAG